MRKIKALGLAAITSALMAVGMSSHAVVLSSGSTFGFSWDFATGNADGNLTGTGLMSITGFTTSAITMVVTLNNTSTVTSSRLVSFGFGIDPNASGISFQDNDSDGIVGAALGDLPGLKTVDVCAYSGPNCSGGAGDGLFGLGGTPTSDTFTLILTGTWGTSVNVDPIGFKYQGGVTSYHFTTASSGASGSGGTSGSGGVPEPHSTALVGLGLAALGLGFMRRRKQAA